MGETSASGTNANEPSVLSKLSQAADDDAGPSEMNFVKSNPKMPSEISGSTLTDSMSTESAVSCRICKSSAGEDLVTSPCHCKGSMGYVHISCLEEWLTGSTRDSCELCSFPFTVVRTAKYGYFRSIWIFCRTRISILRLIRDVFLLSVSLFNTCLLTYMWLAYTFRDTFAAIDEKASPKKQVEVNARLASPFRTFLYSFVFTLCLVFVSLNTVDDFRRIFHFYFMPWYRWWKSNVEVKLVLTNRPKHQ